MNSTPSQNDRNSIVLGTGSSSTEPKLAYGTRGPMYWVAITTSS